MATSKGKTLLLVRFSVLLAVLAVVCFTPLGSIPLAPPLIVATLGMIPVVLAGIMFGPALGSLMGFFAGFFSFIVWTFMPPSIMAFVFTPFYSLGDIHGNGWSLVICFVPRILVGTVSGGIYLAFKKVGIASEKSEKRRQRKIERSGGEASSGAGGRVRPSIVLYALGGLVGGLLVSVLVFVIVYAFTQLLMKYEISSRFAWGGLIALFIVSSILIFILLLKKLKEDTAGDFISYCVSAVAGSMTNTILVLGGVYLFFEDAYTQGMGLTEGSLFGILCTSVITNGIPEAVVAAICAFFICRAFKKSKDLSNNNW
ncbi:MAG: ECF transporter S component [Clostridiales Family XIII bacterium]|jgi:uncharacterized membrane protein|nr:ECF transporter S component [Clostridiales Family XIII bacterium]